MLDSCLCHFIRSKDEVDTDNTMETFENVYNGKPIDLMQKQNADNLGPEL